MGQRQQFAVGIRRQPQVLMRLGPAQDGVEHGLARHHDPHRAVQLARRDRGRDRLGADAQLRAEAAADVGRQDAHPLGVHIQRVGEFVPVEGDHLQRSAQQQVLALPLGDRGMRLHRRGGMTGRAKGHVDPGGGAVPGVVPVPAGLGIVPLDLGRGVGIDLGGLRVVADRQPQRAVARGLERLGHNQRDRLAVVMNLAVGTDRAFASGALRRVAHEMRPMEDAQQAGDAGDRLLIDRRHAAARYRRTDQHTVGAALGQVVGGVIGGAGDLCQPVGARHRGADQTLPRRVEKPRLRFVHLEIEGHAKVSALSVPVAASDRPVTSCSTDCSVRRSSGSL